MINFASSLYKTMQKQHICRLFVFLFLITGQVNTSYAQKLMAGAVDQETPVVSSGIGFEDVASITLPSLSNANAVMVVANFEMQVTANGQNLTGSYILTDGTTSSPEIRVGTGKIFL